MLFTEDVEYPLTRSLRRTLKVRYTNFIQHHVDDEWWDFIVTVLHFSVWVFSLIVVLLSMILLSCFCKSLMTCLITICFSRSVLCTSSFLSSFPIHSISNHSDVLILSPLNQFYFLCLQFLFALYFCSHSLILILISLSFLFSFSVSFSFSFSFMLLCVFPGLRYFHLLCLIEDFRLRACIGACIKLRTIINICSSGEYFKIGF